jgi:TolA-binding protein
MFKIGVYFIIASIIVSLIIGCGEKQTKEQLFALSEKLEKDEKFNDAIVSYQKLIKKFPSSNFADQSQYKIALIYSNNLNDFDKSINAHNVLIEQYPNSKYVAQSIFMIGFIYANNLNNLEKAKEYYNQFLQKYPNHELVNSVKWELDHLGKDINDIDFLKQDSVKANQALSKKK